MKGIYMKKLFVLLLLFFTTDSFASGIASNTASAPCTNNTLETYSGNSNLAADWQPNEIQLRWYNNNTLMDVQSAANTCTYDGALAVPQTAPTRTGYTFAGWTVRPEIDFAATIPTNENGLERWGKGVRDDVDFCYHSTGTDRFAGTVACNSDVGFKELKQQEWKLRFSFGDLYGMIKCSTRSPTATEIERCCWCKATGYKATNANVVSGASYAVPWVQYGCYAEIEHCLYACGVHCAYQAQFDSAFRTALFTPVAN